MIFRRKKPFKYVLVWSTDGTWKLTYEGTEYGVYQNRKSAYEGFLHFLKRFLPEAWSKFDRDN